MGVIRFNLYHYGITDEAYAIFSWVGGLCVGWVRVGMI